jgi:PAS domain-containing protein
MEKIWGEVLEEERRGGCDPLRCWNLELEQVRKDGTTVWTEALATWLRDEKGYPVGILGVTRNIDARKRLEVETRRMNERLERRVLERTAELTEANIRLQREIEQRREAEKALRLTQFAVDQAADPVILLREDGRMAYVNREAIRLLGYGDGELLEASFSKIWPAPNPSGWPAFWSGIRGRGRARFEAP